MPRFLLRQTNLIAGALIASFFARPTDIYGDNGTPNDSTAKDHGKPTVVVKPIVYARFNAKKEIHDGDEVAAIDFAVNTRTSYVAMTFLSYERGTNPLQACGIELLLYKVRPGKELVRRVQILESRWDWQAHELMVPKSMRGTKVVMRIPPTNRYKPDGNVGGPADPRITTDQPDGHIAKHAVFELSPGEYSLVLQCNGGHITRTGEPATLLLMPVNGHPTVEELTQRDEFRKKELTTLSTSVNRLLEDLKPGDLKEQLKEEIKVDPSFRRAVVESILSDKELLTELKDALQDADSPGELDANLEQD